MFNYIFEILFVISSIVIIYKLINKKYINSIMNSYLVIISIFFIVLQFSNNYIQKGGKEDFNLLNQCGLSNEGTGHCFNDATHHTCCMLGSNARKYADNSGNPIGEAALKSYAKTGKKLNKNTLMPWCTCTGSKVCSYYANKFKDGTHIKFIYNPKTKKIIKNPKIEDPTLLGILKHYTPGIK